MYLNIKHSVLRKCILVIFSVISISISGALLPLKTIEAETDAKKALFTRVNQEAADAQKFSKSIKIRLASGEFDPLIQMKPDKITERLLIQRYAQGEEGYYIVQFYGPIKSRHKEELRQVGARIFDYIPDFSFIVKMDEATRARVDSMKKVRWTGIYQPAYRVEPALATELAAGEKYEPAEFIVSLFKEEDSQAIAQQIEQLGGNVLDISQRDSRTKIKIRTELQELEFIAKIDGVRWIEPAPVWKLSNNVAAGIMGVPDVWNTHNLYGAGQIVAVADTGLDRGSSDPLSLHDDFEDGSGNSRVSQIFDRLGDGADDENSGHGTHVAGSVLGNGFVSGSNPAVHDYSDSYAGIAPEATLVFQALENNSTESPEGIPSDLGELFNQAYGAGARIHTNSWGAAATAGAYTSSSKELDQFVWDHKDFLILFAAGNEGVDADGDGLIDMKSLQSPATAKNCIAVGATENDRPSGSSPSPGIDKDWGVVKPALFPADPINSDHVSDNEDGMAAFSGRGPCWDGRFKPDIVAPGTNIISTKSSLTANTALWGKGGLSTSGPEAHYIFSGGTSMSTPLVAGAAALVREFYTDVEGVTPSAALIKTTLLNGAADLSPGQYGTGPSQEIPDPPRPNNVEGWGRLDLENSIFPAAPRVLEYWDETAGLNTGESHTYQATVGNQNVPLKATLVWSDYPGSPVAGGGLANDLDLSVIDPLGTTHYANQASQRGQTQVIYYDDGTPERLYTSSPFSRKAVRFTPTAYPAKLEKGLFRLRSSSFPNTFNYYVYDGSDATGPQNLLASGTTTIRKSGWHVVDLSSHALTVSSGDFFLAIELNDDLQWYADDTEPDGRNWQYYQGTWLKGPDDDDLLFRALVSGPDYGTPYDRVNNVVGIDIVDPEPGTYTIRIEGYNVPQEGPQPYALVLSGELVEPSQYNLTVNTSGQGTVTLDPPGNTYDPGTEVTLTAEPDPGWVFSGWSGDLTGSANPALITMDSNKNVTATFIEEHVNQPPLLDPIGNKSLNEGELLEFFLTATDPDGDNLSFSGTNMPTGATLMDNGDDTATFSWQTGYADAGTYDSVTFTVTDDGSPALSDSETITITVGDVNRPPVLDPIGNKSVDEGALLEFTITASDLDGDNLSFSGTNMPAGATLTDNGNGTATFSWQTDYTDAGTYDSVTFTVTDDGFPALSDSETISISVGEVNRAPDQPTLYLPVDGDIDVSLTPKLETGDFYDQDGDSHAETEWQISNSNDFSNTDSYVFSAKSDISLTSLAVPDFVLATDTTHYWRAKFYDDRGGGSAWSEASSFRTVLVDQSDPDGDGVPDDQEVYDPDVDLDGDGNPDMYQGDMKCVNTVVGGGQAGVKGATANVVSVDAIESIDPDTMPHTQNKPDEMFLGLVSFRVTVSSAGDPATVTVYLSGEAPSGAQWYKCDPLGGWRAYPFAAFGKTADGNSYVTLQLEDGLLDSGDLDGLENTFIVDPGGVGVSSTSPSGGGGGGGGGGCFIAAAAYGTEMETHVRLLHEFRDRFLLTNSIGKALADLYHQYSPPVAEFIAGHETVGTMAPWSLLPLVGVSWTALKLGPVLTLAAMSLPLLLVSANIVFVLRKIRQRVSKRQGQL